MEEVEVNRRWRVVYPLYLNKHFSVSEGRKVSAQHAVDGPTAGEMLQVASHLQIPCQLEPWKRHPRDHFTFGRLRYSLRGEDGALHNPEIASKKAFYARLGQLINALAARGQTAPAAVPSKKKRR